MAKALLVNPPFYRIMGSHYNGMSLGISYIAAVLNRAGHDAWLYNADFLDIDRYKTLYNCFKDFPHYIEIFRDDKNDIWEEVTSAILNFAPAQLHVPADVSLKSVNMAMELEGLTFALTNSLTNRGAA